MYKFRNPKNGQVYSLPKTKENYDGAVAKGYEPVEEVFNPKTSKGYVVPANQVKTALGKGYVTQDGLDTIDQESKVKKYGTLETGAYGAVQGLTFDFADEVGGAIGGAIDYLQGDKGSLSDHYKTNRDSLRQRFRDAEEQNPASYIAGDVVGSVAPAIASGGTSLLASGGKVAAKQAIKQTSKQLAKRGFVDGGVSGVGASEADTTAGVVGDALMTGTIGAALGPAAKFAGKHSKKLIPGHKEAFKAVNDVTATLAKLNPAQNASKAELSDFLSSPKARKIARDAHPIDLAEGIVPKLQQVKDKVGNAVSDRYRKLEDAAMTKIGPNDIEAYQSVVKHVEGLEGKAYQFPEQFSGPVKRVISSTKEILTKGYPGEPQGVSGEILYKRRQLKARRELDNLIDYDAKVYDRLSTTEKGVVNDLRAAIGDSLKVKSSGGDDLITADKLYSEHKVLEKELFQPFTKQGTGLDVDKTKNLMHRDSGNSREMKRNLEKYTKWVADNQNLLGEIPEVKEGRLMIESAVDVLEQKRVINRMNYATGGPTGQAVMTQMMVNLMNTTSMLSTVLLPIVNPQGWTKIVDSMAERGPMDQRVVKGIELMASGIKSHYLKDRLKEAQSKKEAEEERRRIQIKKFLGEKN